MYCLLILFFGLVFSNNLDAIFAIKFDNPPLSHIMVVSQKMENGYTSRVTMVIAKNNGY
jgi:hypothetical protein